MQTPQADRWNLESYFPAMAGPEYGAFKAKLAEDWIALLSLAEATPDLAASTADTWARAFDQWEDAMARLSHLWSYLSCRGAADAADEPVQTETASLADFQARAEKVKTEFLRALGGATAEDFAAWLQRPGREGARHLLTRWRRESRHRMSRAEEGLAADLGIDGLQAWGRLYDTLAGKLTFRLTGTDGGEEDVPMARRRSLMESPDAAVRRAAFIGGNRAWAAVEDSCAAALNALAGTRLTLYGRRGYADFLEEPLQDNAVSRETLDALFAALAMERDLPRRILRAGARLQGVTALGWADLDAPRQAAPPVSWAEGVGMLEAAFAATYPGLAAYFRDARRRGWVEAEVRANKRPGAFCTGSPVTREQRVYMTYNGTMGDVTTLAHEFGHAWHSHLLGGLRPCARAYPMTLAETASTFAENLLGHGLRAAGDLSSARRDFLIEQAVAHAPAYLLNIPVRFLFERRFHEERTRGVVPVSRLKALMVEAQREVYGDTLIEGEEDPWFWASKLHFFITELSFYNYPYTFGFLLSQALYGEFRREGAAFLPRYEEFLRLTGSASCEDAVSQALGQDLQDPTFWAGAIRALEPAVADFEALAGRR
jgi:oligoendopeptidase F